MTNIKFGLGFYKLCKNKQAYIKYNFLGSWKKNQKKVFEQELISVGLMSISFFINHRGML